VVYLSILEIGESLIDSPFLTVVGWVMLILGVGLYLWSRLYIGKKVEFGLKDTLITAGPYQYTRNPLYIADVLIFMGYAVIFNSPYVLIISVILSGIILMLPLIEEPWLVEQYGDEYTRYCSKVPRYLFYI